ncbi:hypothetical protein CQW23_17634 [Capsicum baccatum]|uniref:Non-specific serine/threonine protein kinase n=1 Tax=Capsicum baccatum TaxID=33114 RepID=A0A2G2WEK2_CAPBA|nr:hypothetical protein CQW23_17634 [Capsicum baccatum]
MSKRVKIGRKTVDCVFIEYVKSSKACRFSVHKSEYLDINENTITVSDNAEFFEHIYLYKTRHEQSSGGSKQPRDEPSEDVHSDENPRHSTRQRMSTSFGSDFVIFLLENEPQTFKEVMSSSDSSLWKEAINSEIDSILTKYTWKLIDLPSGNKPSVYDLKSYQMNVKTAFLNGKLKEKIYMEQLEGFVVHDKEKKIVYPKQQCLQGNFAKRPSMSLVIKVLQRFVTIEANLDDNFRNVPKVGRGNQQREITISSKFPSILSGPRYLYKSVPILEAPIPSVFTSFTSIKSFPFAFILCCSFYLISYGRFDYPTANLSTTWVNSFSFPYSVNFTDDSMATAILARGTLGPRYACGFYCNGNCESYLFAIFIVQTNSIARMTLPTSGFPQVVWSANRNKPIKTNATLQFTAEGDLVLRDADGTLAWSTNTAGKSVAGLNLTDEGNLVLFDSNNATVWQSFDHPTDALVPGQKLSNPPQTYFERSIEGLNASGGSNYVMYLNGSLALFSNSNNFNDPLVTFPPAKKVSSAQYMKLESNGHLKVYEWNIIWNEIFDVNGYLGACTYPMVCGRYGICSRGQCSCPKSSLNSTIYFRQIDDRQADLGCSEITRLNCNESNNHTFLKLQDVYYFTFTADLENIDMNTCKDVCLRNCSCKAAFFRSGLNSSTVQVKAEPDAAKGKKYINGATLYSIIGLSILGIIIGIAAFIFLKKKKTKANEDEEDFLDHVEGMPTRFSYDDLKAAMENFTKKLGEGGFGSVFEGCLEDGKKIAVKCLDGIGQIKKSFLVEVETIGSLHHVNLVQLIGFCTEKSHRLLVYEFMSNGSLEKWIYHGKQELTLDWNCRRRIIQDIAKGLSYLHEE